MKTLAILFMLCSAFLTLSDTSPHWRFAAVDADAHCLANPEPPTPAAEPVQPAIKASKIPRWHRLIPGMFS